MPSSSNAIVLHMLWVASLTCVASTALAGVDPPVTNAASTATPVRTADRRDVHRIKTPADAVTTNAAAQELGASDVAQAAGIAKPGEPQHGVASSYSHRFTGRPTASGEPYDPAALTAAHRTLPLGTRLKVSNPANDRSVVVTVNDRGPHTKGRTLDLSHAAARELGITRPGVTRIETEVVAGSSPSATGAASAR